MLNLLETRWPFVSVLLLLALIAVLLFMPSIAGGLAIGVLILGIAITLLFIVQRNFASFARAEIIREKMNRNIAFEILALVLIISLAGIASHYVTNHVGTFVESHWQGFGMLAGFITAIIVSFGVSFGAKWGLSHILPR